VKQIEIRNNSSGRFEVWVDDIDPGGRAHFVNSIEPALDNVDRTKAMIRGLAAMLSVRVVEK